MSDAWYMREEVSHQTEENRLTPNEPCSYESLARIGVYYTRFQDGEYSDDEEKFVRPLLRKLHYEYFDVITISPEAMGDEKFHAIAKQHFAEHIHEDDEVRMILDGEGYFDVRDENDRWVRVLTKAGDCIVVPAGLYHRFSTTTSKYTKALRLFKENPKWVALDRNEPTEQLPARQHYLASLRADPHTAVGTAHGATNGIFSLRFPAELDESLSTIVRDFVRTRKAEGEGADRARLLLYVTGAQDPHTKASWCPDCVAADPGVVQTFTALRAVSPDAIFVECPVQRAAYLRNPEYLYRKHRTLQVNGVPTVLLMQCRDGVQSEQLDTLAWDEVMEVAVRTDDPAKDIVFN